MSVLRRLCGTIAVAGALLLPTTTWAAQNGYCFNDKVGWLDLSGLSFNTVTRVFTGTATYFQGAFPGGKAAGTINFTTTSGQQMGLALGTTATSNQLPVSGQGFSPQLGWIFASHSGGSPLKVVATGTSSGTFVGTFWSNTAGYFNCDNILLSFYWKYN